MASLGDLMARVGADVTGFSSGMEKVSSQLSKVDSEINKKLGGFDALGSSLTSLGATLAVGVTAPIVAIGTAATSAFGEFQGALARASALGDIYGKDLERLKAQAIELGAKTQFSAKQAADGMAELAAAGFNTTQVVAAMPAVLNLAAAGQISVGQSAEIAANIMGGFNIKAEGVGHAVDVMAKAAASGSLGMADLAYTMKYVAPVATAAGLSFEEVTAATTLLSNAGIKGEAAGTGLRGAIASLISPSKAAAEVLNQLGVETTDSTGKLRPLNDIFAELRTAGASTADVFKIFGRETASTAQKLIDFSGAPMQNMTVSLQNSDGAADKMAKTLNGGLGGALERMKGSIETAGISLGEVLAPTIVRVAGIIEQSANKVGEWIGWFQKLPEPVQLGALAFTALVAAAGPVILVAGTMISAFTNVVGGLSSMAGALRIATGEVTTFAAAKTALASTLSAVAVPAILAVSAAILGIQVSQIAGELTNLAEAFTYTGVGAQKATQAVLDHKDAHASLKQPLPQTVGFVKSLNTALESLGKQFSSIKWTDLLTPLGLLRNALAKATESVKELRGVWPEMGKAAETTLKKLQTETLSHMRIQGENASRIAATQSAQMRANEAVEQATRRVKDHTESYKAHHVEAEKFDVRILNHVVKLGELRVSLGNAITDQARMTMEFINGAGPVQAMARALDGFRVSLSSVVPEYKTQSAVITQVAMDQDSAREALKRLEDQTKGSTERMSDAHVAHGAVVRTTWDEISGGINNAVSGFSRNLTGVFSDLFTGNFSIGRVGDAFKQLGLDIANVFLKQATDAVAAFIAGALTDLLSMKGLGGVADALKGIGSAIGSIFGAGKAGLDLALDTTIATAPAVAGAATSGAGAASGAAGAASSGLAGIVGAVGSVVSAVTGIIGNFQNARQETTLNAIEHNTRYSMMYLGERGGGSIIDILYKVQELVWYGPLVTAVQQLRDSAFFQYALPNLDTIQNSTFYTLQKIDEIRAMLAASVEAGGFAGAGAGGRIIVYFTVNGNISTEAYKEQLFEDLTRRIQNSIPIR